MKHWMEDVNSGKVTLEDLLIERKITSEEYKEAIEEQRRKRLKESEDRRKSFNETKNRIDKHLEDIKKQDEYRSNLYDSMNLYIQVYEEESEKLDKEEIERIEKERIRRELTGGMDNGDKEKEITKKNFY